MAIGVAAQVDKQKLPSLQMPLLMAQQQNSRNIGPDLKSTLKQQYSHMVSPRVKRDLYSSIDYH